MKTDEIPSPATIPILARVTCPHCWHTFPLDRALYIAQHPDLLGDPRLGKDQPQRFLPTRFTLEGAALDARGFACHGLACPKCHLPVPRVMFETPSVFFSILGGPACGKSYFLTAMTWRLRRVLPRYFALSLADADPVSNHRLHEYESMQFLNPDRRRPVRIEKTETYGDLYDTVLYNDQAVNYLRPFMFSLTPLDAHPNVCSITKLSRTLCLYDNAGESFLPGEDRATSPVTRHLALSRALLFLFDPTQDVRFRRACRGKTDDPQMIERTERLERERPVRQETIFVEATERIRRYAGIGHNVKHARPLVIVVTKFDSWASLLNIERLPRAWTVGSGTLSAMKLQLVEELSQRVRSLLWTFSPEMVSAAEGFSGQVIYIPTSATGCGPTADPATGGYGFRPKDIHPIWAEVPMLYVMSRWMHGLVPYVRPKGNGIDSGADGEVAMPPNLRSPWSS